MFTGAWKNSYEPQSEISGTWLVVTPENVKEMSATDPHVHRRVEEQLRAAVGNLRDMACRHAGKRKGNVRHRSACSPARGRTATSRSRKSPGHGLSSRRKT